MLPAANTARMPANSTAVGEFPKTIKQPDPNRLRDAVQVISPHRAASIASSQIHYVLQRLSFQKPFDVMCEDWEHPLRIVRGIS